MDATSRRGDRAATRRVHLGLALTTLVLFLPILLGQSWYLRDSLAIHQVWRGWALERLAAGQWPEWFDAIGLGVPAAGNPLYGATYPPTWLMLPLPSGFAVDLFMILHVLLAGAGLARLARRFGASPLGQYVAGASFLASGWLMSMVIMGIPLLTLAWTPHITCAAHDLGHAGPGRRARPALALAALVGLQLTAGDPAAVITGTLFTLIVVLATVRPLWPAAGRIAGAAAAGLPLAALMLLPALAFMAGSERAGGLEAGSSATWSMHPLRFAEWLWPGVYGDGTHQLAHLSRLFADSGAEGLLEPAFGIGMYVSLPVLLLVGLGALYGPRPLRWIVVASTLGFLALALGKYTPLYAGFRAVFLPEQLVRYPERHFSGVMMAWSLAAGVGFTWLAARAPTRRTFAVAGGALALLAVPVAALWIFRAPIVHHLGDMGPAFPPRVNPNLGVDAALAGGFAALLAGALVLAALVLRARPATAKLAPALGAAVIVGHLVTQHIGFLPALDRDHLRGFPGWLEEPLAEDRGAPARGEPRVRVFRDQVLANVNILLDGDQVQTLNLDSLGGHAVPLFGLGEIPGYHTIAKNDIEEIWSARKRVAFERMLDLYDVKWAVLPELDLRAGDLPIRGRSIGRYHLHENPERRPRVFVAPRWEWMPSPRKALERLVEKELDFHAVRLVGAGEPPPAEAAGRPMAPCTMERPRPERALVRCDAPGGWLVVLETWDPGWSARIDGQPAKVVPAEAIALAVPYPAGAHTVELVYRTPRLRQGLAVSAAAWGLWAALFAFVVVRERRARRAPATTPAPPSV